MTRTTPDLTSVASGIRPISLFSVLLMFSWVLPQALNEIDGVLAVIALIRAFTGEVSSRSMCRPGPNVTISISTFSPRSL